MSLFPPKCEHDVIANELGKGYEFLFEQLIVKMGIANDISGQGYNGFRLATSSFIE